MITGLFDPRIFDPRIFDSGEAEDVIIGDSYVMLELYGSSEVR